MKNLKKLRNDNGITLKKLSGEVGISPQMLSYYELGQSAPSIDSIIKVANYFGVSIDFLLDRQFNNNVGYIPDSRKDLVREIVDLSDSEAREVEVFIKGFKAGRAGTVDFYKNN